jgi:hypothetical protein
MNRFMLSVTVATAALLGAYNTSAQTILYTQPGAQTMQPAPLGAFIASRITDEDAGEFKQWLTAADVKGKFDVAKGYTAFVVVDDAFDAGNPAKPVEHYIVNQRVGLTVMHGNQDFIKALNGDDIAISRTGNSYYVDGKRVNGVEKNPEGIIYYIGGLHSATL